MDPITLALLGLPAIYKGIQGLRQTAQAGKVQLRDTTPAAFKEALALGRQSAAGAAPGTGQQLDRLSAGQQSTLAAAERAGTSSSSVLGLLSRSDANRSQALSTMASQQDAYQQQQQQRLGGLLGQQAAYQKADQQTLDTNKAALTQAGQTNLFGALDAGSQVATYGLAKGVGGFGTGDVTADGSGAGLVPALPYGNPYGNPYDAPGYGRRSRYQYGVPSYGPPMN